jgi:O-antigen/teichoic acid export membrane protein
VKNKIARLFKSSLLRNAGKLATGTAISQFLALAFLPILSRTYSQEAFGILAAFSAVTGFISSFATLKYDTALILPKDDIDAYALLKISNITTIIITTVSVLVMFIPIPYFQEYKGLQVFIGFGVLLSVNYNNSALWNIRFKHFNHTSISKVVQSIAIFAFQYTLFYLFEFKGLIFGNLLGTAISGAYLIITRKFDWKVYYEIPKDKLVAQAKRYIDFPKYFTLSNAILSFTSSLPVLLFVRYIPLAQIGVYGMALRLIAKPVALISESLRSVVLGDMAERRNNEQPILRWFLKIFFGLLIISILASIILLLLGDFIVNIFLGAEWAKVAIYAYMLIPILISSMISPPGTAAVRVFEMQRYNFHYSIVSLALKASTLLGLFTLNVLSFKYIILIYALVSLLLVVGNNSIIIMKIRKYEKQIAINKK